MTSSGHEIQLDSADAKAMRDDFPATTLQKADRLFFTGKTTLVARVRPT